MRFISVGPLRSFLCGRAALRGHCRAAPSRGAGVLLPHRGLNYIFDSIVRNRKGETDNWETADVHVCKETD